MIRALPLVRLAKPAMLTVHQGQSGLLGIPARSNLHQYRDNKSSSRGPDEIDFQWKTKRHQKHCATTNPEFAAMSLGWHEMLHSIRRASKPIDHSPRLAPPATFELLPVPYHSRVTLRIRGPTTVANIAARLTNIHKSAGDIHHSSLHG